MKKMRLDKILANSGFGSRKEVKALVRSGGAYVSGKVIKDPAFLVDLDTEKLTVNGEILEYKEFHYLMMNKPAGVISATWDRDTETVLDLLPEPFDKMDLFPAGRLDKDTEGLLLLTDDGQLSHRLLSPKKHVPKTYYAEVSGLVGPEDIQTFQQGILLDEDFKTLPAELNVLEAGELSKIKVTIYEGKFHQVKRMFEAVGKRVLYLKRLSMGSLQLDESLAPGEFRELTAAELEGLADTNPNS
jgi:16S rRNA pseudouridine516 synthase